MISNSKTGDIELKIEETRDLKAARDAYENKDIEASRIAHTVEKKKMSMPPRKVTIKQENSSSLSCWVDLMEL